jgi:hypothetical protein
MEFSIEIEVTDGVQSGGSVVGNKISIFLGCGDHGIEFSGTKENIRNLIEEMKNVFDGMCSE